MKDRSLRFSKKKISLMIFCCFVLFVMIGVFFSNSFALFKKEIVARDIDISVGELTYTLESDMFQNGVFYVDGSRKAFFTVQVTSTSEIPFRYALSYQTGISSSLIDVGYLESTLDPVEGIIQPGETKTISLSIDNRYDSYAGVRFMVECGFDYNPLEVTEGTPIVNVMAGPKVSDVVALNIDASKNCGTSPLLSSDVLAGDCSQNYIWYSGKLWRVVLKNNETGAVKMVTDNAITVIPYGANNVFENSYADQWLQQEFLPTLHDYQDYLIVDSPWNIRLYGGSGDNEYINRTVGLIAADEYEKAGNYLKGDLYWWLLGPASTSEVYVSASTLSRAVPTEGYGIRPAVNLKGDIEIVAGSGTQTDPYRLAGDNKISESNITLLNTKYSGEYVNFGDSLYRIVSIENSLTKITAVDQPSDLRIYSWFHSNNNVSSFADSSIKDNLENYYQNTLNDKWKNLIEPNTTWYLGVIDLGANYKAGICETVVANVSMSDCQKKQYDIANTSIALPRVGEMFSSQITRNTASTFWTLSAVYSRFVMPSGYQSAYHTITDRGKLQESEPLAEGAAHPSMYLKSNVVISGTNTGDGTYEHPYEIELG